MAQCNVGACLADKVDCALADWGEWNACTATCGGGQRRKEHAVATEAQGGGQPCVGPLKSIEPCATDVCPGAESTDCLWSDWSAWSDCFAMTQMGESDTQNERCGHGQKHRTRHITTEAVNGGICDAADAAEIAPCVLACSEEVECGWSDWSDWDGCPVDCGGGQTHATRHLFESSDRGKFPAHESLSAEWGADRPTTREKYLDTDEPWALSPALASLVGAGVLGAVLLLRRRAQVQAPYELLEAPLRM